MGWRKTGFKNDDEKDINYQFQKIAQNRPSKFVHVHSCVVLYLPESWTVARTKSMKKLATPVKNEVDESFIKISHLNQGNKDTYFDYKRVPQIELLMLQVLA